MHKAYIPLDIESEQYNRLYIIFISTIWEYGNIKFVVEIIM